jgi:hypothetical protein
VTRHLKAHERAKKAKALREGALARAELRHPSANREAAAGATSYAVKARDPGVEAAVQAFLAKKETRT